MKKNSSFVFIYSANQISKTKLLLTNWIYLYFSKSCTFNRFLFVYFLYTLLYIELSTFLSIQLFRFSIVDVCKELCLTHG